MRLSTWVLAQYFCPLRGLTHRTARILGGLCFIFLLNGCVSSDVEPSDEGGIIGTGIALEGTASSTTMYAVQNVEIKAKSGLKSTAPLGRGQRFFTRDAGSSGPWLLRVSTGEDRYLYGLSYGTGRSNINTYSDVVLRNWFARAGIDIDFSFDSNEHLAELPSSGEFESTEASVLNIVDLILRSYQVEGRDILHGDFSAGQGGVALYLDRNPVVTSGDGVTFLVTDPTTQTQSSVASQLPLNANYNQREDNDPTVPRGVRVLGSGPNELVVVWGVSNDDTAVASYKVFREGTLVSASPYPVFIDSDVAPGRNYAYTIVATDVWGNESAVSESGTGSTQTSTDTVAPLKPVMLLAPVVNSQRIDLIWGHPDVGDVAKFVLYKGSSGADLQPVAQLTSNYATDINIIDNSTYCYQVKAQDASANLSDGSDVLCVVTKGSGAQSNTPGANNLIVPDVQSLSCQNILTNADVADGAVLQAGCYHVTSNLILNPEKNLTLSAGVVLKFDGDLGINVSQNASLTSLGTTQNPVVLTGMQQIPGYWSGVVIDRSNNRANLIRNTVIEYAGGLNQIGALDVISRTGDLTRLRLENSLLQWSSGYGLMMANNGTVVEMFTGNVLRDNQRPADLGIQYLDSVSENNSFSGNAEDYISSGRNSFSTSINIPDLGVPIRSNGFAMTGAPLNIEPGVEILFFSDSNTEVFIDQNSKITARGSVDLPILLRAINNISGSWGGITIASSADNVLDHVLIENAGGVSTGFPSTIDNGAIRLDCTGQDAAKLSVSNSQLTRSASWGIYQNAPGCTIFASENVLFSGNTLGNINQP